MLMSLLLLWTLVVVAVVFGLLWLWLQRVAMAQLAHMDGGDKKKPSSPLGPFVPRCSYSWAYLMKARGEVGRNPTLPIHFGLTVDWQGRMIS